MMNTNKLRNSSLMAIIALGAILQTSAASAQLATTGADVSPVLSCFYECKPGPDIQGQPTYRQITTLPIVNNNVIAESVNVNFLDGNQNVIATTDVDLPASDLDELAVCATIEAITGAQPPRAGIIQIGNMGSFADQRASGVYSWIKNVSGKFFASQPEPFDGRVVGIAKSECTYVASPSVTSPIRIQADASGAPFGPPILVEDTEDMPVPTQADLVPTPDAQGFFCRLIRGTELEVEIRNAGSATSGPTTTEVNFTSVTGGGGVMTIATPAIAPGASATGTATIPVTCWTPDCQFTIEADRGNVEPESNEGNNIVNDLCLG